MARYLVINEKTRIVENAVEWDGKSKWEPPIGTFVIPIDIGDLGDTYDNSNGKDEFIKGKRE